MRVIVMNSGSSSIKYQAFALDSYLKLLEGLLERIGTAEARLKHRRLSEAGEWEEVIENRSIADHREGLEFIFEIADRHPSTHPGFEGVFGIGHRVVHGGEVFRDPVIIDDEVMRQITDLIPLAPLHNPANITTIEALRVFRPGVPNVAVFDTAFHQTMPSKAFQYALPRGLYQEHHVRRYGFHGTSHRYVTKEASRHLGIPLDRLNVITLHLGNGASATAVQGGRSVDTSMGLTPLEGLVMGTRCGDLDPAVHFYISRKTGMSFEEIETILNKESGLKGICGVNDMREIEGRAEEGDAQAQLAIEMFCYRVKKYIGAYTAALGRVDAVVFTGGIGENAVRIRRESCEGLTALGISLDDRKNEGKSPGVAEIQSDDSRMKILVIPTDEELEIARQTVRTIRSPREA